MVPFIQHLPWAENYPHDALIPTTAQQVGVNRLN